MEDAFKTYIKEQIAALSRTPYEKLQAVAEKLLLLKRESRTVYTVGNGGSSATASHFNNDLVKGCAINDKPGFRSFCLTDAVPVLTALANDYSYSEIFSRQLNSFAKQEDVLIVFSGSGNSPNVVAAVKQAKRIGMYIVTFTGGDGGAIHSMADIGLIADTAIMEQIEDIHMVWAHAIATIMINRLKGEKDDLA